MASTPPSGLPLFYNQLEALSSVQHSGYKSRTIDGAPFLVNAHAIPLTVEEFPNAQRFYPIVFSSGADAVPLALMGLNDGVNVFVDGEGKLLQPDTYVPAYVRRYPWLLAKLQPTSEEFTLCFDPTAEAIGRFDEGQDVFDGDQPSAGTKAILEFCEQFEMAGARTAAFMKELNDQKLLMEGEVTISQEDGRPHVYRGFQMVNEEALKNLRGDVARKLVQSGAMACIFAHLFSLSLIREVFGRQVAQGKMPVEPASF